MTGDQRLRAMSACCLLVIMLLAPHAAAQTTAQLAPQPSATRTTMAEQVQLLQNVPAQYNGAAADANVQSQGVSQFQQWAPETAPSAPTALAPAPSAQAASQQQSSGQSAGQQAGPGQLPPLPQQPGPLSPLAQPNPQSAFNMLGSAVQAAGSVANAGQALSSASAAAGSGDALTTIGSAAQAFQAVQRAASDVGAAQKTFQTGGAPAPASPVQQAAPTPPTININVPGLGGNPQGPPGISYTPGTQAGQSAQQGTGQAYGATQTTGGSSDNPLQQIGSALAQAAFGGGLSQPAGGNTASLQATNGLGRKMM